MSRIVEFRMGKGRTTRPGEAEEWTKKYLEVTVTLPQELSEKDLQAAFVSTEYLIDNWLGQQEATQTAIFNPEDLMKHNWKGKKTGDKQYAKGSLGWGWDFKDEFSEEVLKALEKGPITIDQYEFTLEGNLVTAKKKKK